MGKRSHVVAGLHLSFGGCDVLNFRKRKEINVFRAKVLCFHKEPPGRRMRNYQPVRLVRKLSRPNAHVQRRVATVDWKNEPRTLGSAATRG